jgi:hypothetical protein
MGLHIHRKVTSGLQVATSGVATSRTTSDPQVATNEVTTSATPLPQVAQVDPQVATSGATSEHTLRTKNNATSGTTSEPQVATSGTTSGSTSGVTATSGVTTSEPQVTPQVEFSAEPQATSGDFDFSKILGKSEAEIEKEEKATEEGIDQLTNMVERFWNSQTETQAEGEPWKWTKEDSEMLKRTVMALDAKYGFIGKSLNYVPEIMLVALVVNLVMKGLALRKARSGIQRRSSPESYQQAAQAQESASGTRTIDELNRLAEAEAERLNRERGLS